MRRKMKNNLILLERPEKPVRSETPDPDPPLRRLTITQQRLNDYLQIKRVLDEERDRLLYHLDQGAVIESGRLRAGRSMGLLTISDSETGEETPCC